MAVSIWYCAGCIWQAAFFQWLSQPRQRCGNQRGIQEYGRGVGQNLEENKTLDWNFVSAEEAGAGTGICKSILCCDYHSKQFFQQYCIRANSGKNTDTIT